MHTDPRKPQLGPGNRLGTLFFVAILVGACQGPANLTVNERLDATSGVTLRGAQEAIAFARTESRYSRSARDYIYLGPVETNRQGRRDYYLWVGIATTLDRGFVAPTRDTPQTLQIELRGEPMVLTLLPWSERAAGLQRSELYTPPVTVQIELAARVALDQLDLMATEAPSSIRVADGEGRTQLYSRWDDESAWLGFFDSTAAVPSQQQAFAD